MRRITIAIIVPILAMGATPALAAPTLFTISGTGSGSLAGVGFTNSSYTLSYLTDDRSNTPSVVYFQLGTSPRYTLNIMTAFGTAFTTFYIQNLTSRFHEDFFDFTLPTSTLDIYSPFAPVTGTDVTALGGFRDISTTGGALTLASSSNVRFEGVAAASAVPEPAAWAMMIAGFGMAGFALRRYRDRHTIRYA